MTPKEKMLPSLESLREQFGCAYGYCDSMSVLVAEALKKLGFKPEIHFGTFLLDRKKGKAQSLSIHFWVECEGLLIDLTADQFNGELEEYMPEILCVPVKKKPWHYVAGRVVEAKNVCTPVSAIKQIRGCSLKEAKTELATM